MQLIARLEEHLDIVRAERDGQKIECVELRTKNETITRDFYEERVLHETLKVTRRGDRWKDTLAAVFALVGAGLISSGPSGTIRFALGWAMTVVVGAYQIIRSLANTD